MSEKVQDTRREFLLKQGQSHSGAREAKPPEKYFDLPPPP